MAYSSLLKVGRLCRIIIGVELSQKWTSFNPEKLLIREPISYQRLSRSFFHLVKIPSPCHYLERSHDHPCCVSHNRYAVIRQNGGMDRECACQPPRMPVHSPPHRTHSSLVVVHLSCGRKIQKCPTQRRQQRHKTI